MAEANKEWEGVLGKQDPTENLFFSGKSLEGKYAREKNKGGMNKNRQLKGREQSRRFHSQEKNSK